MSRRGKRGGRGGGRPQVVHGEVQDRQAEPPRIMRTGERIDLGDLSAAAPPREQIEATFGYFGERFRVHPDLSEVDAMDFMDEAQSMRQDDPKALTLVKRWAETTVHPDDFDAFWKVVRKNRQDSARIMALMWTILDGVTDLPTGPPSDSSDGRPSTSPNSPGTSSGPADAPSTPDVSPVELYGPAAAVPVAAGAEAYLRQIDRFQARGDGYGVAMAAQVAAIAEARGVDVRRDRSALPTG